MSDELILQAEAAEPDDVPALLRSAIGETRDLNGAVESLASKFRLGRLIITILSVLVCVLVLFLGAGSYYVYHNHTNLDCIRDWAQATNSRSAYLVPLSNAKNSAADLRANDIDNLIRDIGQKPPNDVQETTDYQDYIKDSNTYKKASTAYNDALNSHPVPPEPLFDCSTF